MRRIVILYRLIINSIRDMGWGYLFFRIGDEIKKVFGWKVLKDSLRKIPDLDFSGVDWRNGDGLFDKFVDYSSIPALDQESMDKLESRALKILNGEFPYFRNSFHSTPDWYTNPITGYHYKVEHWSRIRDFDRNAGDIKFVWEKARFSWVYDLIRYTHHSGKPTDEFAIETILDFVRNNPPEKGPHFRCSQEISIRVLNWLYALTYYKESEKLDGLAKNRIFNHIHKSLHHVYNQRRFSRIALRNNHSITEAACLYIAGTVLPFLPGSGQFREYGLEWFQFEIMRQVYDDGSYIQHSFIYARLVIQLCNWVLAVVHINETKIAQETVDRIASLLHFVESNIDEQTGRTPLYGANDGTLLFPLNECDYLDFRGQTGSLHFLLYGSNPFSGYCAEDQHWIGNVSMKMNPPGDEVYEDGIRDFTTGGYYVIRDSGSLTMIRCNKHFHRPGQADNLHVDIWQDGNNVLRDCGTYMYNTDPETLDYFTGTGSHNTIGTNTHSQMNKGPRFVWWNWSQAEKGEVAESEEAFAFEGVISAFRHADPGFRHQREVMKVKGSPQWVVTDKITPGSDLKYYQQWHVEERYWDQLHIRCEDGEGKEVKFRVSKGFFSDYYGTMRSLITIRFRIRDKLVTKIELVKRS